MIITTWYTIGNGNCEGYIEFELQVVRDGMVKHRQVFRQSWVVINTGQSQSELKMECIRVLMTKRLTELVRMLEEIIAQGWGIDQEHKKFEFEEWEWRIE